MQIIYIYVYISIFEKILHIIENLDTQNKVLVFLIYELGY